MSRPTGSDPTTVLSAAAQRTEHLLHRYPDLDPEEVREVARFLRKGPFLEVHRLTSSEPLAVKVAAFKAAHEAHFKLGLKDYALVVVAVLVPLFLLCWLAWDIGKKG